MSGVLLTAARRQAGRTLGTAGAVAVAVAFVVATLVLSDSVARTLATGLAAPYVGTAAHVSGAEAVTPEVVDAVAGVPGVSAVAVEGVRAAASPGSRLPFVAVGPLPEDPRLRWQDLTAGRWPSAATEAVAVGGTFEPGDRVPLEPLADGQPVTVTIVGAVDPATGTGGTLDLLLPAEVLAEVGPSPGWDGLRVLADDPGEGLVAAIRAALDDLAPGATVRTGEQQVAAAVAEATGDRVAPTLILLVFAGISVLVAGLVIANTQTVVLAQRSRQLALLRCVGATRGQVFRASLGEASVVGAAASVVGSAVGVGLAALASRAVVVTGAPIPVAELAVRPVAVLAGIATGLAVTVAAAAAPARRASRVAPVAALRPLEAVPVTRGAGRRRVTVGLALAGVPAAALVVIATVIEQAGPATFLAAFGLGVVSFLGVVVLAQPATAAAVRVLDRVARRSAPPAAGIALANARRNPRRTGATTAALLVGVTLIATVTVGAATLRESALRLIAGTTPADVVVESTVTPMPPDAADTVRSLEGVADAVALAAPAAPVTLGGADGTPVQVHAVSDASRGEVLLVGDTTPPPPGTLRVGPDAVEDLGVLDGETVVLTGASGDVTLRVDAAGSRRDGPPLPIVSAADLRTLTGVSPEVSLLLVRLDAGLDGAGRADAVTAVEQAVFDIRPEAFVSSPVLDRDRLETTLDGILAVTAALLGVAVVIAVIGVGTTLSLGVYERRQENGLLRALGMTRRQLRGVVVGEAALLSSIAAVAGVALGTGYGAAGAAAMLGSEGFVFEVPAGRLAALVGATVLAGVVAAALPAVRSGRVPPVAAMTG